MLFSSMVFLWCFLPVVILGNHILSIKCNRKNRLRYKNIFLLICSLFFYAWGGIYYLLIMIFSIGINFLGGFLVDPAKRKPGARKRNLVLVIALNLLVLIIFKYFNMIVAIIENIMETGAGGIVDAMLFMEGTGELDLPHIVLPIGISFFTFQSMSYVIDVYRGDAKLQKRIWDFALYVSFFPQLIAGPIVKYSDIEDQLTKRSEKFELIASGQKRFIYGLSKKVIIANTFGDIADKIWALEIDKLSSPMAWLGMIAYTIQIYYDFSGYSDMAIGIGRMLGFNFKENFNYPYTSLSVQDFWRRWHMSLSTWFKEYVYIPLGGSRRGLAKTCLNVFIVFLLTGIWHGANFTFIAWGVFYALLLIIERLFLGKLLAKNPVKPINWAYTIFAVMIAWVFFRSDNISQGFTFVTRLFAGSNNTYSVFSYLSMEVIVLFVMAVLFSGLLQRPLIKWFEKTKEKEGFMYADFAIQMILLFICILKLISGTYNAFIYFQF